MKDKIKKFQNAMALHCRAFKLMNHYCPGLFLVGSLETLFVSVSPYITIFLSAKIITELAGNRNPGVLGKLVLITLLCTLFTELLKALLGRWKKYKQDTMWYNQRKIYADKLMSMDFCSLDDPNTHGLHSQSKQNELNGEWGLTKCYRLFETMISSSISIVSAAIMSISLFTMKVPESAGKLTVLNHPLFLVGLVLVTILIPFLSSLCQVKGETYWVKNAEDYKFNGRVFSFYGYWAIQRPRAMDLRMYNQIDIGEHYCNQCNTFIPGSPIANYAKGPLGALIAASAAIASVYNGFIYVFVCLKAWAEAFRIGSVTQYISSITLLSQALSKLLTNFGEMYNNAAFLKVTFEFLDIPNGMYQGTLTTEKRSDINYEVEFKNVSFKYPNAETYALRNVSLKFKVGQRLAIVGMNGSGKTTFIKLLCRLYDPTEGEILLNGINIRKYNYEDYMNIFSIVFQDYALLPFPLAENVATGKNYDKEQVISALRKSGFYEDVPVENVTKDTDSSETKQIVGLDTYLYKNFDKKGVEISGGEAQKIAIARALYKNAPFIILDEPTAALDPIAEAEIYSKFNDIADNKTAIYISHRLSSCRFCDRIVVFHEGSIIQQGSHEELVSKHDGKYHELWHAQAQYYQEA